MDPNLLATYDIRDYGASITGLASPGINAAVRACAAAGGGTVFVPPGIWRCGTIELASDVRLYLSAGATLHPAVTPPRWAAIWICARAAPSAISHRAISSTRFPASMLTASRICRCATARSASRPSRPPISARAFTPQPVPARSCGTMRRRLLSPTTNTISRKTMDNVTDSVPATQAVLVGRLS